MSFLFPDEHLIFSLVHIHKRYQSFGKAVVRLFMIGVNVLALNYTFFAFLIDLYLAICFQNSFVRISTYQQ